MLIGLFGFADSLSPKLMHINHKIHVNRLASLNIELQKMFFGVCLDTKICHYGRIHPGVKIFFFSKKTFMPLIYTSELKPMCSALLVLNKVKDLGFPHFLE